jgi:hypothetical protein
LFDDLGMLNDSRSSYFSHILHRCFFIFIDVGLWGYVR